MIRVAEHSERSDTGRQRRSNEDSYLASTPVFAVADGMGGARAGEVASQMAVEQLERSLGKIDYSEQALSEVIQEANAKIFEHASGDQERAGMGTTFTVAAVGESEITIAHVGDSRAYLFRDGRLKQLTQDHSLVEELRRQGTISAEEAEEHPHRSIITRALGPADEIEVDTQSLVARSGDLVLLCSDGLNTMVSDEEIQQCAAEAGSLDDLTRRLVERANAHGGKDNITVIAFKVEGDGPEDDVGGETEIGLKVPIESDTGEQAPTEPESLVAEVSQPRQPAKKRRWRKRGALWAVGTLLLFALLAAGACYALRQVYFIGTDSYGLVTVYRGLPYELPFEIKLYSDAESGTVPAASLDAYQRRRLLDHQLRSKAEAEKLLAQLESTYERQK